MKTAQALLPQITPDTCPKSGADCRGVRELQLCADMHCGVDARITLTALLPSTPRVVGLATRDAAVGGNSSSAAQFMEAMTQSFSEQYSAFNLLTQLSAPVEAAAAPTTPMAGEQHCPPQPSVRLPFQSRARAVARLQLQGGC